jgi:multiple sugar transport system substrate-binding protein
MYNDITLALDLLLIARVLTLNEEELMKSRDKTRFLAPGVLLASAALVLSGCAATGAPEKVDSLNLWLPTQFGAETPEAEKAAWEEILAPFEEANGVTVNLTLIPWDSYEEKYLTGVSGNDGPDIGYMYGEMMGDYILNEAIVPFDGLSAAAAENMLYLEQGKVEGEQYSLPFVVGGMRVLWANMDILQAAGVNAVPTTWDEFLAASAKVTASGKTAVLQSWGDPARGMLNSTFFPLLWQAGGQILSDDGSKTAFNNEAGISAANFLMELMESGAMPSSVTGLTNEQANAAFFAGDTAFLFGPDNQLAQITEAGINAEYTPSLMGKQRGTFVASDSLVLFKSCKDAMLCTALAEFIIAGDQMAKFHSSIVAYPPVGKDEKVTTDNPFIPTYLNNADILFSLPVAAGSAEVYNSLYINLQQMILGQKTPEQALKDAAEAGDGSLAQAQ